jgi:hypothetical protein
MTEAYSSLEDEGYEMLGPVPRDRAGWHRRRDPEAFDERASGRSLSEHQSEGRDMMGLGDWWFTGRHQELLREASQERLARELRRARKSSAEESPTSDATEPAQKRPEVRPGLVEDAPRIAELLELNEIPRWVAFEERFIVAEDDGKLVAVLRFREDSERLYLGLLVTDPWAEEYSLAVALYTGARVIAHELGLREIQARTRQNETHPREAGYRRWRGGWRLHITGAAR